MNLPQKQLIFKTDHFWAFGRNLFQNPIPSDWTKEISNEWALKAQSLRVSQHKLYSDLSVTLGKTFNQDAVHDPLLHWPQGPHLPRKSHLIAVIYQWCTGVYNCLGWFFATVH